MLELDEGQLSRPVLRGRGGSNTSLLPDLSVDSSSQRGRVRARVTPLAWRVRRGAKEQWPVVSECKAGRSRGRRKTPEQSQFAGMVQKRPFSGNTWALSAHPDRSRVGAGVCESLAAVPGLQLRENRVYPSSSSQ